MGLGNPALGRTDLHVFNDQHRRLSASSAVRGAR